MGVASLVLGILSLIMLFIPVFGAIVGVFTALIGIILGAVARKDPEKRGLATGGLVCSIIAFVICIIGGIAFVVALEYPGIFRQMLEQFTMAEW